MRPDAARPGENVDIIASLANCGAGELLLDRGLCPDEGSGFRLDLRRGLHEFHLHARDTPEAAALYDTPCVRGGTSVFGLPPAREGAVYAHVVTFRWNGTFANDACWPAPVPHVPACLAHAPAWPGVHELRATITGSGVVFEARANLTVLGEPPDVTPCADLALDGTALTIHNCGATDLTLDPEVACVEGYPAALVISRDGTSWSLAADGRAVTPTGCPERPPARLILAGTTAVARFAWDGTLDDEPAPPGDYDAIARIRAREGGEWEARGGVVAPGWGRG